jgi:uncharacterized membrane protein YozB (DUF420 family)
MPSTVPFWVAFCATVALLASALVTGWTRRRRLHLLLGPLTMVSLTITIVLTEELMRRYRFPEDVLRTHLVFAKAGGLLALPVIVTGVWLWRDGRARRWHRACVLIWLVSVLLATGTGLWLFSHGVPRTE